MTAEPLVAVTGATGELGGRVAARLAGPRHVAQRLLVRDPLRAPRLPGAEAVQIGGYADSAGMRAVLRGVPTLFMVSATESADRVAQHVAAVDAAVAAGVERIVYLSFLAAAPDATFTFARDHFATEQHIRSTGVAFTFLRPSLYLDLTPHLVVGGDVIAGPAGDGRVAWVARDDLADVAAGVLSERTGHDGATYDVTGPRALTVAETAAELAGVLGRPIVYRPETMEEARASRAGYGAAAWEVEGWISSYAAIATGEMHVVSGTVERLAGHPPMGLAEFLLARPDSWRHLIER